MGLLDPTLLRNLKGLTGLLAETPIGKYVRGQDQGVSVNGLKQALLGMPVFDQRAGEGDMAYAMDAMGPSAIPSGLLGAGQGAMILSMARKQARAGGEVGLNSQFYKGGEFLPGSAATEKGKMQFPKALRKGNVAEVEPFVKAERPFDGAHPIMKSGEWDWPEWRKTGTLKPIGQWVEYQKDPALLAKDAAKAEAFNRGARWTLDGKYFDVNGNELP